MVEPKRTKPRKKQAYHHGQLREALVQSALWLIEREGVEELTLRGVAKHAGVSHAAPYHHFKDKNELLAAVAEEGFRLLAQRMREATVSRRTAKRRLAALGTAYVCFAADHPAHFRVMFSAALRDKEQYPGLADAARSSMNLLGETIVEVLQNAEVDSIVAAQRGTLLGWSLAHGLATLWSSGHLGPHTDAASLEDVSEDLMRVAVRGLISKE